MVGQQNIRVGRLLLGVAVGILAALVISFGLLAVVTSLVMNQKLSASTVSVCNIVIHLISVYIAGLVAGKTGEGSVLLLVGGTWIGSVVVHAIMGALVFDNGIGNIPAVLIPELIAGVLSVITLNMGKGKGKKSKIKKRYL